MKLNEPELPIYLDSQASARISPDVREAIDAYWSQGNGNPHSAHEQGRRAKAAISNSLNTIADFIGSLPRELSLVSGATAANNLAIQGIEPLLAEGRYKILVSAIEHPCVLQTARFMAEHRGFELEVIRVDAQGLIEMKHFENALNENVALVSVMLGNNEIGTIQDISGLASKAHEAGALFHTDATQAAGRIPIDVLDLDCDMLSFSAHKMSGPIGVGALFVRDGVRLQPLIHGGGQQPFASGTMSPELAIGFAKACETSSVKIGASAQEHLQTLIGRFEQGLQDIGYTFRKNGPLIAADRLPGTCHLTFHNVDLTELRAWMAPYVSFSTKSACAAESQQISHVLEAIGLGEQEASQSARFSVSHRTTEQEIDRAVHFFADYIGKAMQRGAVE